MNKQRINEIITSPESLQYSTDLTVVNELIRSFPYFSTPYVMLSKMLHDENSIYFDKNLKLSAAYIGNREILYNYIHVKPKVESLEVDGQEPITNEPDTIRHAETFSPETASDNTVLIESFEKEPEEIFIQENVSTESPIIDTPKKPVSELLQYPVSDYLGQYFKKDTKPVETKEVSPQLIPEPEYSISDKKSFSSWLDMLESGKKKSAQVKTSRKVIEPPKVDNPDVNALIDKFIRAEPKIKAQQLKMYKPEDMAKLSVIEDHHIATETLADIYLKQGLKTRALEIFQQLILKFPEKSDYFAGRIKEIQSEGSF